MDQLADVCTGSDIFPDGSVLPVTLRKWTSSACSVEDFEDLNCGSVEPAGILKNIGQIHLNFQQGKMLCYFGVNRTCLGLAKCLHVIASLRSSTFVAPDDCKRLAQRR